MCCQIIVANLFIVRTDRALPAYVPFLPAVKSSLPLAYSRHQFDCDAPARCAGMRFAAAKVMQVFNITARGYNFLFQGVCFQRITEVMKYDGRRDSRF